MNYELLKQLRDAGFPQIWPRNDEMEIHDAVAVSKIKQKYRKDVYVPTLEELIEACGSSLGSLENTFSGWRTIA